MPIQNPNANIQVDGRIRNGNQNRTPRGRFDTTDFTATLSAVNPLATEVARQKGDGIQPAYSGPVAASVTNATINSVAGATNAFGYGAPYLGAPTTGANPYYGAIGTTNAGPGPSETWWPGSEGGSGGDDFSYAGGTSGDLGLNEKRQLLAEMNQSNWEMLVLQNEVQNITRQWTTFSNILQVKHANEMNALRNTGRAVG